MGTKNNPGKFDCYAAAAPDEPMFILLARDRLAPYLVSIWAKIRNGDAEAAHAVFEGMIIRAGYKYAALPDEEQAAEAMECSFAMSEWREKNRP